MEALPPDLAPEWKQAFAEVERLVGGAVVAAESQARWRPAWYLEVDRDGERTPIYFRGDRPEGTGGIYTLEHEMGILQVLEAHGIPVPHIFGFCEKPRGIVMERCPGRANLATAESEAERESVLDHYIELLVEMHRIPTAAFEHLGLELPKTAEAIGLADLPRWEGSFRERKTRPEPLIELALGWLHRNVPHHRKRACFVAGDAGQFVFDQGRVTGVIDLELAFLGEPLADLGSMRSRDISEPLGDLSRGFRRYAELTGEPLDVPVLHYHTVRFGLNTPLAVAPMCAAPPPGLNYAQYLGWNLVYGRLPLEVIAEAEGIGLDPPKLPEPVPTRFTAAHESLVAMLEARSAGDYDIDTALRSAQYLREIDRLGPRLEQEDREEAHALLGRSLADAEERERALEALAIEAPPERLGDVVRFLHRRVLRDEALLRPAMRELEGATFQRITL